MSKVNVYRFIINGELSSQLGTQEAIGNLGGTSIGQEPMEIDESELTDGLTIKNYDLHKHNEKYNPRPNGDFQQIVHPQMRKPLPRE
jgi:hypothetical protein